MVIPKAPTRQASRRPIDGAAYWPFRLLRSLAFLAVIAGSGYGALDERDLLVGLFIGAWAGFAILFMGAIPAVILFLFDVALVRRNPRYRRPNRPQSLVRWTAVGGIGGAVFGAGYGVVYLNAFASSVSLETVLMYGAVGGAAIGILAGRLSAIGLNLSARAFPVGSQSVWIKRGAFLWTVTVAGLGYPALLIDGSFNKTILPAALLALLGAAVIPPLATTPPVDFSRIPPPEFGNAPSPDPNPEGGSGEGARGVGNSSQERGAQPSGPAAATESIEKDSIQERMLNG